MINLSLPVRSNRISLLVYYLPLLPSQRDTGDVILISLRTTWTMPRNQTTDCLRIFFPLFRIGA